MYIISYIMSSIFYIKIVKKLGLKDEKELGELVSLFAEGFNIIFSADTPMLNIVKDDPDDNKFIVCSAALKCSYIISGDKHLKKIKNYMGIKILNPKEFLIEYDEIRIR